LRRRAGFLIAGEARGVGAPARDTGPRSRRIAGTGAGHGGTAAGNQHRDVDRFGEPDESDSAGEGRAVQTQELDAQRQVAGGKTREVPDAHAFEIVRGSGSVVVRKNAGRPRTSSNLRAHPGELQPRHKVGAQGDAEDRAFACLAPPGQRRERQNGQDSDAGR